MTGLDVCGTVMNCDKFRCVWNSDGVSSCGRVW